MLRDRIEEFTRHVTVPSHEKEFALWARRTVTDARAIQEVLPEAVGTFDRTHLPIVVIPKNSGRDAGTQVIRLLSYGHLEFADDLFQLGSLL